MRLGKEWIPVSRTGMTEEESLGSRNIKMVNKIYVKKLLVLIIDS
uniref:Uncharacterized protein n=1 Tax=Wolbachia endosymbiont of Aleurodicus floccissimus TaxID=2152762 RepID=A0A3B0IXR3_9RICK